LLLFVAYGHSRGSWSEVFGLAGRFLAVLLVLTWPVFFLFWLPMIICQSIILFASPRILWERAFGATDMSTDFLIPAFNESRAALVLHYIYIGIPFAIFSLIMIVLIVCLAPVWYFVLSPIGLGTLGISMHVTLHFPNSVERDLLERMATTYKWGVFTHVYALALPFAVIGICHLAFVGVTWYGCLVAICTCLQFAIDAIPSMNAVVRGSSAFHD
jgi:hypothetical protein